MYDRGLRRFGYLVRVGAPSPLVALAERAGLRPRAMNRAYPRDGHLLMRCPFCDTDDAAYIEPDRATWTTLCQKGELGLLELHAVLVAG